MPPDETRPKPPILAALLGRALLVGFGVALPLVAGEIAVRNKYPREVLLNRLPQRTRPRFVEHPFLPYTGAPHDTRELAWKYDFFGPFTMRYRTNRYGFLGPEFRFEKKPNELVVVTLGGSTTFGMGIDRKTRIGEEADTWPNLLARRLEQRFPRSEVTVYNLSQDAFSSPMSVVNLAFVGVDLHPDVVISYDGANDMSQTFDFDMRTDYADRYSPFRPSEVRSVADFVPAFLFRSSLMCWLAARLDVALGFTKRRANALLVLSPTQRTAPFHGSSWNSATLKNSEFLLRNLTTLDAISRGHGAVFVGATLHYFSRDSLRNEYNRMLREFFERRRIPYFDADLEIPKQDTILNTDEVHFTREGCERMADGFAKVVARVLERRARPAAAAGAR